MDTTPNPKLLKLCDELLAGGVVKTRQYVPDGSHVDWLMRPLPDGRFHLQDTPVEVWQDAGSVGMASYPGKTSDHYCTSATLLDTLHELLGPDPAL
ncbi:MAG: hypothetical protein ACKVY0_15420 [Prosthecobacter sp.]|uniref:hypothetical protein n=1 Tax=Prosthecobacter sp. TaxID=1965333 RepID=UPI0039041D5F